MTKMLLLTAKFETGFQSFFSGNTSLRDEYRPRRSSDDNRNALRESVECNICKNTGELALDLKASSFKTCYLTWKREEKWAS